MIGALLLVLAATFAVYAPVLRHGFVEWDDPAYVTENSHVRAGLGAAGIAWAFASTEFANWHPLTWLSHMLDVSLFGLAPWGHHLTSLLLHLANTVLLFCALRRLTRSPWRSLAVSALFALHPLHVESVAWVSERKDVLSTSFWFGALWAWARFVEGPSRTRYALVALCLVFGLMAKPMLVTVPLTLLILDAWPLGRLDARRPAVAWSLVREKLPLFALALAASLTTWLAQKTYGAVTDSPLPTRVATAVIGTFGYIEKTLWPAGLCAFYPYQLHPPGPQVATKAAAFVLVTAAIAWSGRRRAYLVAGWAWYLLTLAPVIGLVRIGQQEMADRYTYVPLVGIFVMLVWGAADLASLVRMPRAARASARLAAVLLIGALGLGASRQVGTWKNGVTLWERAISVGGNSTVSQNNLGVALESEGRLEEAAAHLVESIRLEPRNARAHSNLGNVRFAEGRFGEAVRCYDDALHLDPGLEAAVLNVGKAHYNLANSLWREGHLDDAIREYREAITSSPSDAGIHRALGIALMQRGRPEEALSVLRRSLEIDPGNPATHDALASALYLTGDDAGAWREVQACRARGGIPSPSLLARLSQRTPEPR